MKVKITDPCPLDNECVYSSLSFEHYASDYTNPALAPRQQFGDWMLQLGICQRCQSEDKVQPS